MGASPHLTPIPHHRVGSAHCHHEGTARAALQVHKAVLVYAREGSSGDAKIGACFRVGSALAAGLGLTVVLQPPGQSGPPAPPAHSVARSCSRQTRSCRCQRRQGVCTRRWRRKKQERQARLRCDSPGAEGCGVGGHKGCRPNSLTVFQSALLLLPRLTWEQLPPSPPIPPFPSSPSEAFHRSIRLQTDRSASKEPRGEAANIAAVIACPMSPQQPQPACTMGVCLGHEPLALPTGVARHLAAASTIVPQPRPPVPQPTAALSLLAARPLPETRKRPPAGYLAWTARP